MLSAKGALENRPAAYLRVVIELAQVMVQPDSAAQGGPGCLDVIHRRSSLSVGDRAQPRGNRPMADPPGAWDRGTVLYYLGSGEYSTVWGPLRTEKYPAITMGPPTGHGLTAIDVKLVAHSAPDDLAH